MIKFINERLFDVATKTSSNEEFYRTTVKAAIQTKNNTNGEVTQRTVGVITSAKESLDDNVRIWSTMNEGKQVTKISVSDRNKFDTDVYFIAIPFNGIIKPISKSYDFKIYKGFTVRNEKRNIEFEGKTYKKIAYMIVVPNSAVFDENHKYAKDELTLRVETVNLENCEDGTKDTIQTTTEIIFTKDGVKVANFEEVTEPIDSKQFINKKVFPIFQIKNEKYDREKKPFVKKEEHKQSLDDMLEKFNKESSDRQGSLKK